MFSCEFCEISKSMLFTEHLLAIVSVYRQINSISAMNSYYWSTFFKDISINLIYSESFGNMLAPLNHFNWHYFYIM